MAKTQKLSIWNPALARAGLVDALRKLDPRVMVRNPVMFVVEAGAVLTTVLLVSHVVQGGGAAIGFELQITLWLWATVLFANLAEAMAEGRGKAQADTLRKTRTETFATRRRVDGSTETVAAASLRKDDVVVVKPGEFIPSDGEVIEGVASVDESAITGESAPVIREAGGDRSAVTGGTKVLSDGITVLVTADPGHTFLDRMISLVEGAERQKTPNEIALNILLAGLTIVFLMAVVTLQPFAIYAGAPQSIFVLVALLVCLIPTTIGGLLSAIGIAGMDRLIQHNVLAMSGRAVEAAGDVHTLLLDKTGTITLGNRQAAEFIPMPGVSESVLANAAQLASLADETPEGRSWCWQSRNTASAAAIWRPIRPWSCPSRPRHACRASISTGARSARAPPIRWRSTCAPKVVRRLPTSMPSCSASPAPAARRSWWPSATASWGSSI
jgi:potassium-transporting ATPase ATP-binding subunit